MDLADRVAVITGVSRGLGAGIAQRFAERGLRLGLCSRGQPILAPSERVVAERLDVVDGEAVERFALRVEERLGTIDLWINNAGILEPILPLRDIESGDFRRHLEVNVLGVFHGSRAYLRHLRKMATGGVLLNISSGAGRRGYAGWSAYCAGKAAVDLMTEAIQLEEQSIGLRAHSVAPGVIDTAMQELIRQTPKEHFPMVDKFHELKRRQAFTTAEEVADGLLALAFDPKKRTDEVLVDLRT